MKALRWLRRTLRMGQRTWVMPQVWPWLLFGYKQALQDIRSGAILPDADSKTVRDRVNEIANDWIEK